MGFFQWSGFDSAVFIGWDNYRSLVNDPVFWRSLWNNLFLMGVIGFFSTTLGLYFTLAINKLNTGARKFFDTIFFLPQLVSLVVLAMIWSFIYNPTFGLVNSFLRIVGLQHRARAWLGDPQTVLWALVIPMIWYYVPFYLVLYTAGLRNIPVTYFEAADLDGASGWKRLIYITLPLLWEHVKISVLNMLISLLGRGLFAPIRLMTGGGPDNQSEIVVTYLYRQAFVIGRYGYATAIGVAMFLILLVLIAITLRIMRREAVQY